MTYTVEMLSRLSPKSRIEDALDLEYRFTSRAQNTEASKRAYEQLLLTKIANQNGNLK